MTEDDLWLSDVELKQKIEERKEELLNELLKDFKNQSIIDREGYQKNNESSCYNFFKLILKDEKDENKKEELKKKYYNKIKN